MANLILYGTSFALAAWMTWAIMGYSPIVCYQPRVTEENYVRLKVEAERTKCLLIWRDDKL